MKISNKILLNGFTGLVMITGMSTALIGCNGASSSSTEDQNSNVVLEHEVTPTDTTTAVVSDQTDTQIIDDNQLDANEQTHLMFMREEEKLARDVYLKLGEMYPDSPIFGNIDDSEQQHTTAVKEMIEKYGLEDPNTNDNVGAYTGAEYGWYFTEKFDQLVTRGSISELEALYVGAFIEELDMMDINQCPKVIVEADNGINDVTECGKIYTDNEDITQLYNSLLDGSDSHLAGYVKNIEKRTGEGSYVAQVLPQSQVDAYLGR
ncbi:DUF2202 domain-containing protein [uncultured Cocleimonas sp.]|uniref:DUF2202 domain-containing protein n=1 Tax=uncultured Cocleimonas sp. TaxID=1051587 RepID=UPI002612635A|nr:DUF2202 domain-containing protein [uncultured Cocleimonas sp.]